MNQQVLKIPTFILKVSDWIYVFGYKNCISFFVLSKSYTIGIAEGPASRQMPDQ